MESKVMFKHFIWDFDGTLFDSYPIMARACKTVMEEEGFDESVDKIMSLMKVSMPHLYEYCMSKYSIGDEIISKFSSYCRKLELEYLKPFPYIEEVLRIIHMNKGMNYLYTHRGKSSVEFIKKFGLYDYFRGFITKEDNFKRKPEPEALLYLINKYSIYKREAIMVGDRDIDILAARNAGIASCFFDNTKAYKCELADYSITDYSCFISTVLD